METGFGFEVWTYQESLCVSTALNVCIQKKPSELLPMTTQDLNAVPKNVLETFLHKEIKPKLD